MCIRDRQGHAGEEFLTGPAQLHVAVLPNGLHKGGLAQCKAQTLALAQGVVHHALVGAKILPVRRDETAGLVRKATAPDEGGVVAVWNEADFHAVRAVGAGQAQIAGNLADVLLFKLPQRQAQPGQNIPVSYTHLSKDDTAAIADEYERLYPGIVRAVHQENGGHGAAVMAGLKNAQGRYFKVVDSDDWVDEEAYAKILCALRDFVHGGQEVDLVVSNFVYDKVGARHKKVMSYANALPEEQVIGWDQVGRFHKGQYILMHSVIYRTQLLIDSGLDLPRHTFYVDNLFVYVPMQCVKSIYLSLIHISSHS